MATSPKQRVKLATDLPELTWLLHQRLLRERLLREQLLRERLLREQLLRKRLLREQLLRELSVELLSQQKQLETGYQFVVLISCIFQNTFPH
jgi:hypothetical protein